MKIVKGLLIGGAGLWMAIAWAQQKLEIVPLKHRLAEQVVPVLQPMVESGGSLSSFGNKLFIRTSAANFRQLLEVLEQIDTPLRKLLISVRQGSAQESLRQGASADVTLAGKHATASVGEPVPGGGVRGRVYSNRGLAQNNASQQVQTVEGGQALIQTGTSMPLPMRQVVQGPRGVIATDSVQYVDVSSGFYATPHLNGNIVTLDIAPQQQRAGSQGSIESSRLSTTVSGRVGEWIRLGGSVQTEESSRSGGLHYGSRQESSSNDVWLKVDLVE